MQDVARCRRSDVYWFKEPDHVTSEPMGSTLRELPSATPQRPVVVRTSAAPAYAGRGFLDAVWYRAEDDFASALNDRPAGIVLELSRRIPASPSTLSTVARAARSVPLCVYVDTSERALQTTMWLSTQASCMHAALCDCDSLGDAIDVMARGDAPITASHAILKRLASLPQATHHAVIPAAVLASTRRVSVRRFSELCNLASRTLDWRLRQHELKAHSLLAWMVCLHGAWRIDVLGWTLKRAAFTAGFGSPALYSKYMFRHAAVHPSDIVHGEGFWSLLDRFSHLMAGVAATAFSLRNRAPDCAVTS